MFRIIVFLLVFTLGACSSCSEDIPENKDPGTPAELDYSLLQYRGRVEMGPGNTSSFSTPGSSIKVKFRGTSLYATFSADNFGGNGFSYIYVVLDENADPYAREIITIQKEKQEYLIVGDLDEGEHTVELIKKNECWGQVQFKKFRIPDGEILVLPEKKSRLIEFYGDSNPSGWSAWDDKDKGGEDDTEGYFTYPGFTARALDAEWVNFSAGGFGITDKMGRQDLTDYYDKVHVYTNSPGTNSWNFSDNNLGRKPDVVVINLGANDYYRNTSKSEQKAAWHRFVSELLRPEYPDAHFVLANSYGWATNEPTDYLEEVVEEFKNKGEDKVSFVKFPWLWGQEHAVISEHAGFARILSTHIAEVMSWEADPVPYSSIPEEAGTLGNSSFESSILGQRPDGWRPDVAQSNARWVESAGEAKDGEAFVRTSNGHGVHQAIDATPGDQFIIKVWAKSSSGGGGVLKIQFRGQAQNSILLQVEPLELTEQWQQFELTTEEAPEGSWQIDVVLKADHDASADFDMIDMSKL